MRKEVRVTLEDGKNRHDFVIEQMPASQLEWWIIRAVQALGPALEIPEGKGLEAVGEALANKGIASLSKIDPEKAKPLLDEMLSTASRLVDGARFPVTIDTVDGYIETIQCLFRLRVECFKANFSFFGEGSLSTSQESGKKSKASSPIRMSHP